jgi:hypothetical protein
MKQFILTVQFLFFCVFFSIGAGAIVLSILIDPELTTYYSNLQYLEDTRLENETLVSLTDQYQAQIDLITKEPNVLGRLKPLTFGRPPAADEQTAVPTADSRELMQTAKVILDAMNQPPPPMPIPKWLERCMQKNFRTALFASGAGLVLISFIFFGTPKPQDSDKST